MKDLTVIYELNNNGVINRKAEYTLNPKKALICYIMQFKRRNFNTWEYPENIEGIRESDTVKNHFYYDDIKNDIVVAAYPM